MRRTNGFTLVEILVVLAIIAILAALLFPAFRTAQENGKQANCASSMQQIYLAVRQYYDDEKKYPASASVLLPKEEKLDNTNVTTPATTINGRANTCASGACDNVRGTGYLKSTSSLLCPDDDTTSNGLPRSSYSNIATGIKGTPADPTPDLGRYVWNYWGYKEDGFAYDAQTDATYFPTLSTEKRYFRDPNVAYDATNNPIDPLKAPRLSNRNAPQDTIITHCVFHRMPTSNLAKPTDIYVTDQLAYAPGARDIVLRLDGKAESVDVTSWKGDKWIKQIR